MTSEQETKLGELKMILREREVPFFEDSELEFQLSRAGNNVERAAYACLLIKAENSTLQVSGLSLADTSAYWRRLANLYRPSNSGILQGG